MTRPVSRRRFLRLVPAAGLAPALGSLAGPQAPAARSAEDTARVHPQFPSQDPALVKEMVSVAHFDPARVRALVEARPALARAAWDWGFGDWETALGAPSHMGNREIAETLLAHGARPTIFSAAMLGQLDVVKAFVAASPGVQRTRGPHGITLLAHARAGKEPAAAVARYLEALGDADPSYPLAPLDEAQRAALVGAYRFGPGADDRLDVALNRQGQLAIARVGGTGRALFHRGDLTFHPAGAEAVRIRFRTENDQAASLEVTDGDFTLMATREG